LTKNKDPHCSFCGKEQNDVEKLIVGGDEVGICNDCVTLCVEILQDEKVKKFPLDETKKLYNPVKIKEYLDEYIIGQDEAKISLSVAVCQHFKRINHPNKHIELEKTNVLMLGPTGCGKTMLAKKIANYLDIPFAVCDATGLTEAGYVGDDVESVLTRLINVADGDIEKAQRGIIYIDEIDKLARKGESMSITRDVSGEGVQQALLKMIEGSVCRVPAGDKRKHPKGDMLEIDTSKILFICGGAFVGIDKIIQRRRGSKGVGFGATIKTKEEENLDVFKHHTTKDLISYGMIPEFVGRFGITVSVEKLTEDQLVQILKEPKNSLIKQYQYIFELDGLGLTFEDSALKEIAHKATQLDTNARGLKSILEKILLPYQFDAVDLRERGLTNINITTDAVNEMPAELTFEKVNNEKIKQS